MPDPMDPHFSGVLDDVVRVKAWPPEIEVSFGKLVDECFVNVLTD